MEGNVNFNASLFVEEALLLILAVLGEVLLLLAAVSRLVPHL